MMVVEESKNVDQNLTEVFQINGQQTIMKSYRYKVIIDTDIHIFVAVIAPSSTIARLGIEQQFPNKSCTYDSVSTVIIQCNGNPIII